MKVSRGLDDSRLVSALPKGAESQMDQIVLLAKPASDLAHRSRKRNSPGSDRQVVMVGHQASSKHREPFSSLHTADKIQKAFTRIHIRKNRLTVREPVVHIINPALYKKPRPPFGAAFFWN